MLSYQVQQLLDGGVDEVIVVLGYKSDEIHREIRRLKCRVMLNARYHAGRAGSLRIGARAVDRDAEAIVILNVDQPCSGEQVRRLLAAHDSSRAATRPASGEQHGHPIVVSGWLRPELLEAVEGEQGLRGILRRHEGEIADIPADELSFVDLDTPEEYRQALERFGLAV